MTIILCPRCKALLGIDEVSVFEACVRCGWGWELEE